MSADRQHWICHCLAYSHHQQEGNITMSLRHATTHDLLALAPQLAQYADWHAMHEFVREVYGSHAVRVEVKAFAEYNDETYDPDVEIAVFDVEGKELKPDLSREKATAHIEYQTRGNWLSEDDYVEYRAEELFRERFAPVIHLPNVVNEDWEEVRSYDLIQPPLVPEIYLVDEA
jgi:hypothetical protein